MSCYVPGWNKYYKVLLPDLNQLMCYMTFIGSWRDQSPLDVIDLKRRLDRTFFCAAPLFSSDVMAAYHDLMTRSFQTFGRWGDDAHILTNAYRRRQSWRQTPHWDPAWDQLFELDDSATISGDDLMKYRNTYDSLVASIVRDLDISRARSRYTTDNVSLNAYAPNQQDVLGRTSKATATN